MVPEIFARTYAAKRADAIRAQARLDGIAALQFNPSRVGVRTEVWQRRTHPDHHLL
jgi:hypothetical protein